MASQAFVIVGAGLAGAKAAEALRGGGFDGQLTVIGEEGHLPYERPPLSKDYLAGKAERDSVFVHDQAWYLQQEVGLRLGRKAAAIDRAARQVLLDDGASLPYDKLLIATAPVPGGWRTPAEFTICAPSTTLTGCGTSWPPGRTWP